MAKRKTSKKCMVCQGDIIEVIERKFDATYGPPIDGPGSESQWYNTKEYYCSNCGLVYKFLPQK